MPLHPCPSCSCHVATDATACPQCGGALTGGFRDRRLPAAALLMGLALTACTGQNVVAMYGVAITDTSERVDADSDGFFPSEGDCDDTNADIHPDAPETPGDGVDSNCNEDDDT